MSTINANNKVFGSEYAYAARMKGDYLHFELFCGIKDSYDKLRSLREQARNHTERVSRIYRLFEQDCLIQSTNDPLNDLKLQSKQMVMIGNDARVISPKCILAFACETANYQTVYFGLSEFPQTIEHNNQTIPVRKANGMMWRGFVQLTTENCNGCEDCLKTQTDMIALMKYAEELGILQAYSIS